MFAIAVTLLIIEVRLRFMIVNVLFLLCIAFLPVPTDVLAENLPEPHQRNAGAAFYSGAFLVTAAVHNLLWWHPGARGSWPTGPTRGWWARSPGASLWGPTLPELLTHRTFPHNLW